LVKEQYVTYGQASHGKLTIKITENVNLRLNIS
jgi:hypothetical protein